MKIKDLTVSLLATGTLLQATAWAGESIPHDRLHNRMEALDARGDRIEARLDQRAHKIHARHNR